MQQRGVDLNQVENEFVQMAYTQMRTQAERDVRGAMLLDKIAELENVQIPDVEVDEEIGKLAEYYRSTPEEVRESLEKQGGGLDNVRNNLKTRKSIEALIDNAKIIEGEWVDEKAGEPVIEQEGKTEPKRSVKQKSGAEGAKKPGKRPRSRRLEFPRKQSRFAFWVKNGKISCLIGGKPIFHCLTSPDSTKANKF